MAHLYYPKADREISGVDGGSMVGGPPRGVVHTTETGPIYRGATFYHIQIDYTSSGGIEIVQFIPLERASRALRNHSGGVQTNRQGDYCLNVAIADYAKNAAVLAAASTADSPCVAWAEPFGLTTMATWPDAIYNELGELMEWAEPEMGIPLVFPEPFDGGDAYGYDGSVRISNSEWLDLSGWVGHQHVPENTHWDPGRLQTDKLEPHDEPEGDDDMAKITQPSWLPDSVLKRLAAYNIKPRSKETEDMWRTLAFLDRGLRGVDGGDGQAEELRQRFRYASRRF